MVEETRRSFWKGKMRSRKRLGWSHIVHRMVDLEKQPSVIAIGETKTRKRQTAVRQ